MSRYTQRNIYGEWQEDIYDRDGCRYLIDEVCCNADCEYCCDFPFEENCGPKACPHFTPEEE